MQLDDLFHNAQSRLTTVRDWLRFGVSLFNQHKLYYGHGTTNAHDEAAYLILHSLHLPLDVLEPYLDAALLENEIHLIAERFKTRVKQQIPAPYITNEAMLQGYSFYVDARAIIPRSFIPELILDDKLLPWLEQIDTVNNVLDLCTGNGSIAIIAADYFYHSAVIAADIDPCALEVAKINLEKYQLEDRVHLVQSDLWNNIPPQIKFDVILTNPPYVDRIRMDSLTQEYLHEPQHALFGGDNGLSFIQRILNNATSHLNKNGILIVEMGDNRDELEEMYPELAFTWIESKSGDGFVFVLTAEQLYSQSK